MNIPEMPRNGQAPLESWKEIAAYLQRDATTVRRWEKEEGLPVHRHAHRSRSSVYAYPSEIDAWRTSRNAAVEPPPAPASTPPLWRRPAFAVTVLACLFMAGNGIRPQAASAQQGPLNAKRLLAANKEISYYTISPDGQWLGGTDWIKGDLVLAQVSTGKIRRLVPGTFDKDPESWGEAPILSPDQKQVAYWWSDYGDPSAHGQLRVMPNHPGAKSRVLTGGTAEFTGDGAIPIAWSPDGKRILAALDKLNQPQSGTADPRRRKDIAWISAADGSVQVIKTLDPWNSGKGVALRLSPDGRYVAYSARIRPDAPDTCICILSADGATQAELVRGNLNEDPVWTPDGGRILFSSNRSGTPGLWSVPVRDGKIAGLPSLLKPDTGTIRPIGMTRSGRYYYSSQAGLHQIFVADMDPATGKARGTAVSVTESFVGEWPAWSRNGKWLAFERRGAGSNNPELILHSMEKGTDSATDRIGGGRPVWYLDGSVQINGSLGRMNVSGGQPREITAPIRLPMGALSPNDELLYVGGGGSQGVEVIEVATGERKQMFTVPGGFIYLALSPDGKTFGIVGGGGVFHLSRIAVDGSDYREIYSGVAPHQAVWTRDGRAILFIQQDKNSAVGRMMRIPAEGGQPEFTGISAEGLSDLDLSPDGSKIAYSVGSSDEEVWALDNVLSMLK